MVELLAAGALAASVETTPWGIAIAEAIKPKSGMRASMVMDVRRQLLGEFWVYYFV